MNEINSTSSAQERARQAVASMSIAEKAKLTAGASFWSTNEIEGKVPSVTVTDGPNGLRKQTTSFDHMGIAHSLPATCFPSSCLSACTFDPDLIEMAGRAIGEECRKEDVAILLAPGINIKRHPLGGRNFEYFSEDPLLSGKMGAAYVKGVQSTGVGACIKHMAANSQETRRMSSDSVVDEATLENIYLRAFENVVKDAKPAAVMPAYNALNGKICAENNRLLTKLRYAWGFDGCIISDWGGMDKSVDSVQAGLDLTMPGPREDHIRAITTAVEAGELSEAMLNRAATSVAELIFKHEDACKSIPFECDFADHLAISQLVAEAGCVLLKNDGALPVKDSQKIAVIGAFAKEPRYQGSGSSRVNPIVLDNAWDALSEMGLTVSYAPGYDAQKGTTEDAMLDEAAALAAESDVVLLFVGLPDVFESEGFDRANMDLPQGMNDLAERVIAANPNTAVVVSGGGCVEMPWRDGANAILVNYLAGCRCGHATANVLTGAANPSGRLAESWPKCVEDTALGTSFPTHDPEVLYIEGPYVGYRYYHAAGVEVAYPFGHGLSYSTFTYSGMNVEPHGKELTISLDVRNESGIDGFEVVQVYVSSEDSVFPAPPKRLAGFKRAFVPAGQTVRVKVPVDSSAFSYWDTRTNSRRIDEGTYKIMVGASCEDIRLRAKLTINDKAPFRVAERRPLSEERAAELQAYFNVKPHGFTKESFEKLYNKPLPKPATTPPFTPNSCIGDLRKSKAGSILLKIIEMRAREQTADDEESRKMMETSFYEMPLRSLVLGKVPYEVICSFTGALNGHFFQALKGTIGIITWRP